jgi:hypothetical protein
MGKGEEKGRNILEHLIYFLIFIFLFIQKKSKIEEKYLIKKFKKACLKRRQLQWVLFSRKMTVTQNLKTKSRSKAIFFKIITYFVFKVKKYEEKKDKQLSEAFKKIEIKNDWPNLSEAIEQKQTQQKFPAFSKPIKINKASPVIMSTSPSIQSLNNKQVAASNAPLKPFAWGNSTAPTGTSPLQIQSPAQFSLQDVMNEELKKNNNMNAKPQVISSSKKIYTVRPDTNNNLDKNTSLKGWNYVKQTSLSSSNSNNSFLNIIEMEKRSKEHYTKLRNRPLHIIQLEEKAVQDLKVVYDVDNLTEMTITVEVIDETELASIAPIWKK